MSHPPFFVSEPNLTPSNKKLGLALGKVCFVKRLRLFWAIFGDFGECGYYRDFGEKPHYPLCPHSPLYQPRAKRTTLLRQNFVMPRLCYGSAKQKNLVLLSPKSQSSVFRFHLSVYMSRRHNPFHFTLFLLSLPRICALSLPPQGGGGKSEQHRAPRKLTA